MDYQKLLEISEKKLTLLEEDRNYTVDSNTKFKLHKDILDTLQSQLFYLQQILNNTSESDGRIIFMNKIVDNLKFQIHHINQKDDGIKTRNELSKLLKLLKEKVDCLKMWNNIEPNSFQKNENNREIKKATKEISEIEKSLELECKNLEPMELSEEIDNVEMLIQEKSKNINKFLEEIITRQKFLKYGILMIITLIVTGALSNLVTSNKEKDGQEKTKTIEILRPDVKWTLKSGFGEYKEGSSALFYDAPNRLKKKLAEMTGGRFILEIEYNTDNKSGYDILSDVSNEQNIQCSFVGPYYDNYQALYSLYFNCTIPFGLTAREHIGWLSRSCKDIDPSILKSSKFSHLKEDVLDDLTYAQTLYKRLNQNSLNIIPFPLAATGEQIGGWFTEKIEKVEDFTKVEMRIPAMGAEILRKLQATVKENIKANEIITKLDEGVINSVEWINPHDDFNYGLNKLKHLYYPAWWEPSTTFEIQVNFDEWNDLPSNYRAIFKSACWEIYLNLLAEYDNKNSLKLQEIEKADKNKSKDEKIIQDFSPEILENAYLATEQVIKEYKNNNAHFKEVYQKWYEYKKQIQLWSNYVTEVDRITNITEWRQRGWIKETQSD